MGGGDDELTEVSGDNHARWKMADLSDYIFGQMILKEFYSFVNLYIRK